MLKVSLLGQITDDLSLLDYLDISEKISMIYFVFVTGWEPYDLHYLVNVSSIQGWICTRYIQIQHNISARQIRDVLL